MHDMADYRKDADRCYELARQMAKPEDLHAADYCFGGNRDCGGETCIGLDESCVETCAGRCAGFGSGMWAGLSGGGTGLSGEGTGLSAGGDESF